MLARGHRVFFSEMLTYKDPPRMLSSKSHCGRKPVCGQPRSRQGSRPQAAPRPARKVVQPGSHDSPTVSV